MLTQRTYIDFLLNTTRNYTGTHLAAHLPEIASNPASGRLMLKNGMVKEGELVQHTRRDSQYHDLWQYRLTRAEYRASRPTIAP